MSVHTKQALEQAIAAHLRDEYDEAFLTGYVIQIAGIDPATSEHNSTVYLSDYMESQPYHSCVGLSRILTHYFDASFVYTADEDD